MVGRNDVCWCGSGKKWKKCHFPHLPTQDQKTVAAYYKKKWGILVKTEEEIHRIRQAAHCAAQLLDEVASYAQEGISTLELDAIACEKICAAGALPASLGYGTPPFPNSLCTSVNEVICHGIPQKQPLRTGDIVNIDLAVIVDGYFGDCSKMVAIGPLCEERKKVFDTAYACLLHAIAGVRPGALLSEIGERIEAVAHQQHCSVVTDFVGHGVGIAYHEAPQVPHYKTNLHIPLVPGMIFTIEPMINAGRPEARIDTKDQWTARTIDGKASAQYEHQLLVTQTGVEILTPWHETTAVLLPQEP